MDFSLCEEFHVKMTNGRSGAKQGADSGVALARERGSSMSLSIQQSLELKGLIVKSTA